jgi:hypothetical protein
VLSESRSRKPIKSSSCPLTCRRYSPTLYTQFPFVPVPGPCQFILSNGLSEYYKNSTNPITNDKDHAYVLHQRPCLCTTYSVSVPSLSPSQSGRSKSEAKDHHSHIFYLVRAYRRRVPDRPCMQSTSGPTSLRGRGADLPACFKGMTG